MKRIFILGVCALFIACNSSSEKASETTDSSTVATADTTAVVSVTDTASTVAAAPVETPAVTQPATAEAKASEAAPAKSAAVKETAPAPAKPAAETDNGDVKKGEALIAKSDCFACHKVQEKVLGPSYKDVANKYEKTKANIDYLVNKIKTGGSGVWGAVPMSPHPALSDDDAKAMVQYILSLK